MRHYFRSLLIEPTNICNLHCPICPTGSGLDKRRKGVMNFKQFKRIIDPLKNSLQFILLAGYGEPFLAPDIFKMIDYVGENNIHLSIFTNGTVLDKKAAEHFKENYKIEITFAIDGLNQKSYGYYRKGGRLKDVLENLSYLTALKEKRGLSNLMIIWQFLIMKSNEHQIQEIRKAAEKLKVNRLKLKTLSIYEQHPRYNDFAPLNRKFRRLKNEIKKCHFINPGEPFILWNGDVVPCCVDFPKDYLMGNVLRSDLRVIWNSEKYVKFRKEHEKGENFLCNNRCRYAVSSNYVREFNFKV